MANEPRWLCKLRTTLGTATKTDSGETFAILLPRNRCRSFNFDLLQLPVTTFDDRHRQVAKRDRHPAGRHALGSNDRVDRRKRCLGNCTQVAISSLIICQHDSNIRCTA